MSEETIEGAVGSAVESTDGPVNGPVDGPVDIDLVLNGRRQHVAVGTSTMLLAMLRERFGLTGVRGSCQRGVCGACTVLLDGRPVASCSLFAFDVDGATVETIEGQQGDDGPSPVQQAFAECGGFQCGYCTPGMIMLATALLRDEAKPDREEIRRWIGSNICRCTGYEMIIESVERAAEAIEDDADDEVEAGAVHAEDGTEPDDGEPAPGIGGGPGAEAGVAR